MRRKVEKTVCLSCCLTTGKGGGGGGRLGSERAQRVELRPWWRESLSVEDCPPLAWMGCYLRIYPDASMVPVGELSFVSNLGGGWPLSHHLIKAIVLRVNNWPPRTPRRKKSYLHAPNQQGLCTKFPLGVIQEKMHPNPTGVVHYFPSPPRPALHRHTLSTDWILSIRRSNSEIIIIQWKWCF